MLGDVADAFARIEDPAEGVYLSFKLFDSQGVSLMNLLRDGSGALDGRRERAQRLGIVLEEARRPVSSSSGRPVENSPAPIVLRTTLFQGTML